MNIEKIQSSIDTMNQELAVVRQSFQEKMQAIFKESFKEFFEANPEVTAIIWRQYTPYFNDGDACVFNSYASYAAYTNAPDYHEVRYGEYAGEHEDVWVWDSDYGDVNGKLMPSNVAQNAKAFNKILDKISDDVYLQLFGDHCIVYATRDGFDVTEYEHD
jgi:hypothetical protein